ncbi:hypothetical protein SAMN04487965_1651 [Microbulbifer donghaiensis]|uniref:Uncharacterized protein n=1 Tax=Microbulbifer donghaiensis TaxID=494016 RepID=A0A1M4ZU70_9GAMM|nr:hypothetical protein [Microbulbifer donghaiensis]SHF21544.1 hypothetical protein SAMN04487965_1651 [Microbulbifer donghaiensis]
MKNSFSRGCTLLLLCLAYALSACTSGSYYSSAAPSYARPYTYPSSGTSYYSESAGRYSRSYSETIGTATLPYSSYYTRYPDYPREIYYSASDYYQPYEYYRPYRFYSPYQYYRHRPYKYYRYPPHKKKDRDYRAGKRQRIYRGATIKQRYRTDGDLGLRGTYRIQRRGSIRGEYRGGGAVRIHQGYRTRGDRRLQRSHRSHRGSPARYDRRAGGINRPSTGRYRHRATSRGHRPATSGLRR